MFMGLNIIEDSLLPDMMMNEAMRMLYLKNNFLDNHIMDLKIDLIRPRKNIALTYFFCVMGLISFTQQTIRWAFIAFSKKKKNQKTTESRWRVLSLPPLL